MKKSRAISDPAFSHFKFLISYLKDVFDPLESSLNLSMESHEPLFKRYVLAIFVTHTNQLFVYSTIPQLSNILHLKLVPYYFFNFRLPNPINPTMPAPSRSIITSSEIGNEFVAKMLKLKASAF
jgi:hypothetical protein